MSRKSNGGRLVLWGVFVLALVASLLSDPYTGILTAARAVLVAFVVSRALLVVCGQARDMGEFVTGVGGLLYVVGLVWDAHGGNGTSAQDYDFLLRSVGLALAVIPLVLEYVPELAHVMGGQLQTNKGTGK